MTSLSTHVLDAGAGGARPGVTVTVADDTGTDIVAGVTDADGRIADLASGLAPGTYRIRWATGGGFLQEVSATLHLSEDRHYHVPLLASAVASVVYLGV